MMWRVLPLVVCGIPSAVGAISWMCQLSKPRPIVPPRSSDGGRLRHLLRAPGNDAILLPGGYIERRTRYGQDEFDTNSSSNVFNPTHMLTANVSDLSEANVGDNGDSGEPTVYVDLRLCGCARSLLQVADEFYCPALASYCSVLRSRHGEYHRVTCIQYKNWMVQWSRKSFYYILFLVAMMCIFLFCSKPGHVSNYCRDIFSYLIHDLIHTESYEFISTKNAIKYPLSRLFPKINRWIAEKLLQAEIQSRNRIRAEYEDAARMKRRMEGWISGYSIKTKLHSNSDTTTDNQATKEKEPQNCRDSIEFDPMCTICLLEVNDGDRVADLSCGHVFHPDCLGEWILKRARPVHDIAMLAIVLRRTHIHHLRRFLFSCVELMPALPGSRHCQSN